MDYDSLNICRISS